MDRSDNRWVPNRSVRRGHDLRQNGRVIEQEYPNSLNFSQIPPLTPKFMITVGLLIAGVFHTAFGSLQWSPPGASFIAIGMIARTVEGLGVAAFFTSCYTLLCLNFPNHISKLFVSLPKLIYWEIVKTSECLWRRPQRCVTGSEWYSGRRSEDSSIKSVIRSSNNEPLLIDDCYCDDQLGEQHLGAGFCLPFFVMGGLILIGALLMHFLMPSTCESFVNPSQSPIDPWWHIRQNRERQKNECSEHFKQIQRFVERFD